MEVDFKMFQLEMNRKVPHMRILIMLHFGVIFRNLLIFAKSKPGLLFSEFLPKNYSLKHFA